MGRLYPWQQERLRLLSLLAGGCLLFYHLIAWLLAHHPPLQKRSGCPGKQSLLSPRTAFLLVLAAALIFVVAYSWLSIARHHRFNSTGYDLAINEQIVWNTLHGDFFASSLEVDNSFADHFRPFLMVPMLVYAIFPSPVTLLILQALVLALGALPLYNLARRRLPDSVWPLLVTLIYLLYPALGFISRFDFHIESFAIPAFLAAFDALDQERWDWATFWLVIPLLCKENLGLTVAAFGLYVGWVHKRPKLGLAWITLGLATFWATSFWLIPMMRGEGSDTLSRYAWLGDSPLQMLRQLILEPGVVWAHINTPERWLYLLQLALPTGCLCLLGPFELVLAAPGLLLNLLADFSPQVSIYYQYSVPVVPFIFIAFVLGLQRARGWLSIPWQHYALGLLLLVLPVVAFNVDDPFTDHPALPALWEEIGNAEVARMALAAVPSIGSVVTTNAYAPYLAQRRELYIIGIPSQRIPPPEPDVVLINLYDQRYIVCDQYREYFFGLAPDLYGVTFRTGGLIVVQKGTGDYALFQDFIENWNNCAG